MFVEWKPCEPNAELATEVTATAIEPDDTEWVIEEAEEANTLPRSAKSQETHPSASKKEEKLQYQKFCFSTDLGSLRSFVFGNEKKGLNIYCFINVINF